MADCRAFWDELRISRRDFYASWRVDGGWSPMQNPISRWSNESEGKKDLSCSAEQRTEAAEELASKMSNPFCSTRLTNT